MNYAFFVIPAPTYRRGESRKEKLLQISGFSDLIGE